MWVFSYLREEHTLNAQRRPRLPFLFYKLLLHSAVFLKILDSILLSYTQGGPTEINGAKLVINFNGSALGMTVAETAHWLKLKLEQNETYF